jgi:hypothetical protein
MSSLDSLPGDQRAVLQLVLGRGRSYSEIARLLSIDPSAVRERALAAFEALGPQTKVSAERRAMITDYLLGQLPEGEVDEVRDLLAEAPSERAWARVLSSELAPLANDPLPEIPVETSGSRTPAAPTPTPAPPPSSAGPAPGTASHPPPIPEPDDASEAFGKPPKAKRESVLGRRQRARAARADAVPAPAAPKPQSDGGPRSSRRGGMLVIVAAVVIVAVVLIVVLGGGSSPKKTPVASTSTSTPTTSSTPAASSTTSTTSTAAKVISQINLTPPAAGSKAAGIAEVLSEGSTDGIAIVAQNVPANTTKPPNAYAVWLYNSPTDAHILGFVNPGVASNGRLSTAGGLPSNASHYKQLIVTVETSANPKAPGQIILQGTLTGL